MITSSYPRIKLYSTSSPVTVNKAIVSLCRTRLYTVQSWYFQAHNRSKSSIWPPAPTNTPITDTFSDKHYQTVTQDPGRGTLSQQKHLLHEKGISDISLQSPVEVVLHLQAKSKTSFPVMFQLAGGQGDISPETKDKKCFQRHRTAFSCVFHSLAFGYQTSYKSDGKTSFLPEVSYHWLILLSFPKRLKQSIVSTCRLEEKASGKGLAQKWSKNYW